MVYVDHVVDGQAADPKEAPEVTSETSEAEAPAKKTAKKKKAE